MLLEAGTRVFHGTTFRHLASIARHGLQSGDEAASVNASCSNSRFQTPPMTYITSRFQRALGVAVSQTLANPSYGPADLPVVLEIELGEDCRIGVDRDYIIGNSHKNRLDQLILFPHALGQEVYTAWFTDAALGRYSWEVHASATILLHDERRSRVPAEWVKTTHWPEGCGQQGLHPDDVKEMVLSHLGTECHLALKAEDDTFGITALRAQWLPHRPESFLSNCCASVLKEPLPWMETWDTANFEHSFGTRRRDALENLPLLAQMINKAELEKADGHRNLEHSIVLLEQARKRTKESGYNLGAMLGKVVRIPPSVYQTKPVTTLGGAPLCLSPQFDTGILDGRHVKVFDQKPPKWAPAADSPQPLKKKSAGSRKKSAKPRRR